MRPHLTMPLQEEETPEIFCACTEKRPCEDTVRTLPSTSQEERSHQKPIFQNLDLRILASQNCEKICVNCLSHLVCGPLLWQPG